MWLQLPSPLCECSEFNRTLFCPQARQEYNTTSSALEWVSVCESVCVVSPGEAPHLCAAGPPAASVSTSPASCSEPPPAAVTGNKGGREGRRV